MFELTSDEWENLRFQIGTSSKGIDKILRTQIATSSLKHGGRRFLPIAFTEQGVAMLSAVLKSETAVKISIQIMSAFVALRKTHLHAAGLYQRIEIVEKKQIEADGHFNKIFSALEKADKIPAQGVFFDGQIFDAYKFISDIIKKAKNTITLIDNYIDESTLELLSKRNKNVKITIYTGRLTKTNELDFKKWTDQYGNLDIQILKNNHDRFLIIDQKEMYHIGASLKDLGKKIFAFSRLDNEIELLMNGLK